MEAIGAEPPATWEDWAAVAREYRAADRYLECFPIADGGYFCAYAMQAGRDVRVMVLPDVVDDLGAQLLARDIAKQIEEDLTYPGQIKVTVVRESRAVEVAR